MRSTAAEWPSRCRFGRCTCTSCVLDVFADGIARLDLLVSSGTYVRAIAESLGGHCASLRRTRSGPFRIEEADPDPPIVRRARGLALARRLS